MEESRLNAEEILRANLKNAVSNLRGDIDAAFSSQVHEAPQWGDEKFAKTMQLMEYRLKEKEIDLAVKQEQNQYFRSVLMMLRRVIPDMFFGDRQLPELLKRATSAVGADELILWEQTEEGRSVASSGMIESEAENVFMSLLPRLANSSGDTVTAGFELGNYIAYTRTVNNVIYAIIFMRYSDKEFMEDEQTVVKIISDLIFAKL